VGGGLSPRLLCVLRCNRGSESTLNVVVAFTPPTVETIIPHFICLCATGYRTTQSISSVNMNRKLFAANILLCELPTRFTPLLLLSLT